MKPTSLCGLLVFDSVSRRLVLLLVLLRRLRVIHHLSHTTLLHYATLSHTNFVTTIFHTPSFTYHFVTHKSSHTTCFTSRSSTTSFVFPSFPVPATTFVAHYHWKKLTCGVIGSFHFFFKTSRRGTGLMVRIRVTIPNNSLELFRLVTYCDLSR